MKAIDSLLDLENFVIVMIKFELISSGDIILNFKVKRQTKQRFQCIVPILLLSSVYSFFQ